MINYKVILVTITLAAAGCGVGGGTDEEPVVIVNYTYDELNRLVEVARDDGPQVNYAYDEVSNITQAEVSLSSDDNNNGIADFAESDVEVSNDSDAINIADTIELVLLQDQVDESSVTTGEAL